MPPPAPGTLMTSCTLLHAHPQPKPSCSSAARPSLCCRNGPWRHAVAAVSASGALQIHSLLKPNPADLAHARMPPQTPLSHPISTGGAGAGGPRKLWAAAPHPAHMPHVDGSAPGGQIRMRDLYVQLGTGLHLNQRSSVGPCDWGLAEGLLCAMQGWPPVLRSFCPLCLHCPSKGFHFVDKIIGSSPVIP